MKRTKIEMFVEQHNLTVELDIRQDVVHTMIYKEGSDDLYITSYAAPTMNESIELAVKAYMKKNGLN